MELTSLPVLVFNRKRAWFKPEAGYSAYDLMLWKFMGRHFNMAALEINRDPTMFNKCG